MLLEANVDDYPSVQLQFNYRSPVLLDTNSLNITENGVAITEYVLEKTNKTPSNQPKQLVILIENSYRKRFDKQRGKVKKLWDQIADAVIKDGDAAIIATFDWSKNDDVLILESEKPQKNPREIQKVIQRITAPPDDGREHESTEIFPALMNALQLFDEFEKSDSTAKAILLFSSEFNNIYNNVQTKADVILAAREAGVPIYSFRYPYSKKYNLKDLTVKTYGEQLEMTNNDSIEAVQLINGIPQKYHGYYYDINFQSPIKATGEYRTLDFQVTSEESFSLKYSAPDAVEVFLSKRANLYLLVAGGVVFLALLFAGFRYLFKKRRIQADRLNAVKENTQKAVAESEERIKKEKSEAAKRERNEKKQEFMRIVKSRFANLPRLPKLVTEKGEVTEINKPVFFIGRNSTNDLVISHNSVSKIHAVIMFDHLPEKFDLLGQNQFVIVDLESTNGTLHNKEMVLTKSEITKGGKFSVLQNNNLIRIGEATLTFLD